MTTVITRKIRQNDGSNHQSPAYIEPGDAVLTGEKDVAVGVKPVDRHVAPLSIPASEKRFFFQRGKGYDPNAIATQVRTYSPKDG